MRGNRTHLTYLRVWPVHILELRAHSQHLHLDVISSKTPIFLPQIHPHYQLSPLVVNSRSIVKIAEARHLEVALDNFLSHAASHLCLFYLQNHARE